MTGIMTGLIKLASHGWHGLPTECQADLPAKRPPLIITQVPSMFLMPAWNIRSSRKILHAAIKLCPDAKNTSASELSKETWPLKGAPCCIMAAASTNNILAFRFFRDAAPPSKSLNQRALFPVTPFRLEKRSNFPSLHAINEDHITSDPLPQSKIFAVEIVTNSSKYRS